MRRRAAGALVAVIALVAACGSRVDSDETVISGGGGSAEGEAGAEGGAEGGEAAATTIGDLETPCGEGDAAGATDTGVTDDAIQVGTITDEGNEVTPGLNVQMRQGMEAFAAYCNELGGINGRELEVVPLDAALFDYDAVVREACDSVLALVGGGGALDAGGAQTGVDCGLPDVAAFAVSPQKTDADLVWQPLPNPSGRINLGSSQWVAEEFPDAAESAGIVFSDIDVTRIQADRLIEGLEASGFEVTEEVPAQIMERNWTPIVLDLQDVGVEYITMVSEPGEFTNMQNEMVTQGFEPEVVELEANFYDQSYLGTAGETALGNLVRITIWPFEEADQNPATQFYVDMLEQHGEDGAEPALLGVQALSAGLLFATAASACGAELTRACLETELDGITEWTGGGLHGPTNPAEAGPSPCFIVMEVVEGGDAGVQFERRFPDEDFDCADDNVIELEGDFGEGATAGGG